MNTPLAVLGIDAAWTSRNPSGVCVVAHEDGHWRCRRVASSFAEFLPDERAGNAQHVIEHARHLLGGVLPHVIAVDIPVAKGPIVRRRAADSSVSRAFGRYACAAHSPSQARPGIVGERLQAVIEGLGYDLATNHQDKHAGCKLIEVYPHPAIVRLLGLDQRLPYKVGRASRYWPKASPVERRTRILNNMGRLLHALSRRISDVPDVLGGLSPQAPLSALKRAEDTLDAVVCAWVGIEFLEGRAQPYGDETAAIWVPAQGQLRGART